MKTAEFLQSMENRNVEEELGTESEIEKKEKKLWSEGELEMLKSLAVLREKEHNYQCSLCRKIFSTEHFAHKHIMNKHNQYMKVKLAKMILLQLVRTNYLKDPNSKIPNVVGKKSYSLIILVRHRINSMAEVLPESKNTKEVVNTAMITYGI